MASVGVGPAGRTARPAPRAAGGRDLPVLTEGRSVALLVALTAVAFVLRAVGLGQGPFGDELFTVAVIGDGPGGVLDGIDSYEQNPPLYYYLSVLAPEASDPLLWPRVLSLLFATASVPLVFVLGRRTVGMVPGLIAAGILALSPFLVFYGTEARGYAAAMLFVLASTVALLAALPSGSVGHWALFWAASTAAMYTHYTSAFALAAQAVWALCAHPQRWRGLVVAELAVAVAWLPWLPWFLDQADAPALATGTSAKTYLQALGRAGAGHPFIPLGEFLGRLGRAALVLAGVAAVAGAGWALARRRGRDSLRPSSEVILLALLALAAPLGILTQGLLTGDGFFYARNMIVSVPAAALLAAAIIATAPRVLALTICATVALVLGSGALKLTQEEWQRPNTKAAAHYVDDTAGPAVPVVQVPSYLLFATATPSAEVLLVDTPLADDFEIYLERPHRLFEATGFRTGLGTVEVVADPRAWAAGERAGKVVVAAVRGRGKLELPAALGPPRPPPAAGLRLVGRRTFPGLVDVDVLTYVPVKGRG